MTHRYTAHVRPGAELELYNREGQNSGYNLLLENLFIKNKNILYYSIFKH